MRPLLELSRVSKCYQAVPFRSLLVTRFIWRRPSSANQIWALREIDLLLEKGKSLAILGRNASGKTTLLRLLSGITAPTEGEVWVRGSVTGILEVGTGFHPDMTGRENIFFNASLCGIPRVEIRKKLDQIIEFAGIGRFIDLPVRTYSAGMFLRLGFSISVHTAREMLLVDEALAVGDSLFQKSCLEKLKALKEEGVTLVLVSHQASLLTTLCEEGLLLEKGRTVARGTFRETLARYHQLLGDLETGGEDGKWRLVQGYLQLGHVLFLDGDGLERSVFQRGEDLKVHIPYRAFRDTEDAVFGMSIHREDGLCITSLNTRTSEVPLDIQKGEGFVELVIHKLPLLKGRYDLSVAAHSRDDRFVYDVAPSAFRFEVEEKKIVAGIVALECSWRHDKR